MSKRKRDPTFAFSEKEALLELVKEHFQIVESKKTDAVSIRHKNEEWHTIATEFNAISGIYPRDWKVLKNCWENLKKRAKQEQTLRNQDFLGTGGGPPHKNIDDPIIIKVLELIQARVSGFVNSFDSDGTQVIASSTHENTQYTTQADEAGNNELCNSDIITEEKIATTSSDVIIPHILDWSQYTPSMLKEKINPALAESPTPDRLIHKQTHTQECHALSTPPRVQTPSVAAIAATTTSRRRPVYKREKESLSLIKEKIETLNRANAHAEEEHEMKIKILKLQEEKEKELLKQEKLKTKQEEIKLQIFQIQLSKLKE